MNERNRAVGAADLLAQIETGTAPAILDVRSRREYLQGHVPGACHVPFWAVSARLAEVPTSPTDPLVVYCGHGPRALIAASVLRAKGFRHVILLEGHWSGWKRLRLPEGTGPGGR